MSTVSQPADDHSAVPTLTNMLIYAIANKIELYYELPETLPGDIIDLIFQAVHEKGRITPKILRMFLSTSDPWVVDKIKALKLDEMPYAPVALQLTAQDGPPPWYRID